MVFVKWNEQQGYTSAYSSEKISPEERDHIPFTFLFILNENKEFQIGNKLISYTNGIFYENSLETSGELNNEKKVFASVKETTLQQEEIVENSIDKVAINANGGEYKGWKHFEREKYREGCGIAYNKTLTYRLVHYLIVQTISGPSFTQSDLLFKLRMSQQLSTWHYNNTTTERLYSVNLSGSWFIKNKYTNLPLNDSQNFSIYAYNSCSNPLKGTWTYHVGNYNFVTGAELSNYIWDVRLSGSVFHKINGDTQEINENIYW